MSMKYEPASEPLHISELFRAGDVDGPDTFRISSSGTCFRRNKLQRFNSGVWEQLKYINVQRFRGGLVFKAHRLCVSLNSRLESNQEEKEEVWAFLCVLV